MLVELDNSVFGYRAGRPVVRVEGRVALEPGRCLGVYGPNGAGKTTLLRGMLELLPPMSGGVRHARPARRGYLPQHRQLDLNWPMTALDAASLALSARRRFGWIGPARRKVRDAMALLKVGRVENEPFATLSGGQQQRILLAGALADQPELLVLDEPTDDLDAASRRVLLDRIAQLVLDGVAAVMVSHEAGDLRAVCTEALVLTPSSRPGQPSVARLVPVASLAAEAQRPADAALAPVDDDSPEDAR